MGLVDLLLRRLRRARKVNGVANNDRNRATMGDQPTAVCEDTSALHKQRCEGDYLLDAALHLAQLRLLGGQVVVDIVLPKGVHRHKTCAGDECELDKALAIFECQPRGVGGRVEALRRATNDKARGLAGAAAEGLQDVGLAGVTSTTRDAQLAPQRHFELKRERLDGAPETGEQLPEVAGVRAERQHSALCLDAVGVVAKEVVLRGVERGAGATHNADGVVGRKELEQAAAAVPFRRSAEAWVDRALVVVHDKANVNEEEVLRVRHKVEHEGEHGEEDPHTCEEVERQRRERLEPALERHRHGGEVDAVLVVEAAVLGLLFKNGVEAVAELSV
eukprot:PhM_4_TR4298/c0_g1_i1/m.45100